MGKTYTFTAIILLGAPTSGTRNEFIYQFLKHLFQNFIYHATVCLEIIYTLSSVYRCR
jgi:hypothetical protein